jgi:class 3 adenylate cyclase
VGQPELATPTSAPAQRPAVRGRTTIALVGLTVVSVFVAATAPLWWRFGGPVSPLFWHGIASGLALAVAGLIGLRWRSSRAIAHLLLGASILYFIAYLVFSGDGLAYTIGLLVRGTWLIVAGHAVVAFPEGRLRSRLERVVVGAMYAWSLGFRLFLPFIDPREFGCTDCPAHVLLLEPNRDVATFIARADSVIPIVVTIGVLTVLARRWRQATKPERRVLTPVYLVLGINAVTAIALFVADALLMTGALSEADHEIVIIVERTSLALLPIGMTVGIIRGVLARSAVGNLLVRVAAGRMPDELERDAAWALGDPGLVLAVRGRGTDSFVDSSGREVDLAVASPEQVTYVTAPGEDEVALLHDRFLALDQPELLDAVVAATRMALENRRLSESMALIQAAPLGLAERLQRDGVRIGESETRSVTILMSDIRDYSTIAERVDPTALAAQLHEHRVAMSHAIAIHSGTVMQYVGDSVFAVFGVPVPVAEHARGAVLAAAEMQRVQREINEAWRSAGLPEFPIGIGVTTGDVAAGLLGSDEHVEYSVVGDVVNLAQRIQSWAGPGEVVVDEATHAAVQAGVTATALSPQRVKGRDAVVAAYRIETITIP